MAITVLKDYSLPFAKNDDYIYIDSDKKNEPQFKYGMRFLFNEQVSLNTTTNTMISGYIDFNISDASNYKAGDVVYLQTVGANSVQYNPVPMKVLSIELMSVGVYRFTFDTDKLNSDSWWWLNALKTSPSLSDGLTFSLYKVITKKVSPNADGYGVFSVNDIMRNLLEFNPFDSLNDNFKIDFKYLPFESFFFKQGFELITSVSGKININATYNNEEEDRLTFGLDDFVVVEFSAPLDSADERFGFYTGTQQIKAISFGNIDWNFLTSKPSIYGDFTFAGKVFRADYSPTSFTNSINLSTNYTSFYVGLNDSAISGLTDLQLNDLIDSYLIDKKYLSYSPVSQNTFIEDYGFLSLISNVNEEIIYNVIDVDGVSHSYQLNLIATDKGILNTPSNPASINESTMTITAPRGLPVVRECDKSYKILNSFNSDVYNFNIKEDTKFERVRLLFADELGSLNGFNFDLNNSENISIKKSTFTQERGDFSSLNTIKYNNQSRGKIDINTEVSKSMTLNSDFLSQEEGNYFESLITSNNVFAQYKGKIFSVNIGNVKTILKDKQKGKIRYSLKIGYSNKVMIW